MSLTIISTNQAPAAVGPYSQGVKAGPLVFTSRQIAINPENGQMIQNSIEEETRQCLKNAQAILENAGASLSDVVKVNVFIQDMTQFGSINNVYSKFFNIHKPARACVEVAKLPLGANVEIEMVAYVA